MNPLILFDGRLVLDKPTGIGQYISSLIPKLVECAPEFRFILLRRPDPWRGYCLEALNAPNLEHYISGLGHMSLFQHVKIPRLGRKLGANLIHYPHFDAPVFWGSIPIVATIHDLKYFTFSTDFNDGAKIKSVYMQHSFKQTLLRSAAVISVSNATSTDLNRLFKINQDSINVIYEAPDQIFRPVSQDISEDTVQKFGISRPFILSVGERRPHKNHVGLIEAYGSSQSHNSHDLVIIGQPHADYDAPEEKADELGIANQVYFLTDINQDALAAFYTAADLFVLVSFYEGFGLPILEAMACDTPVVCSSTTAAGEIGGDAALLVDPYDVPAITNAIDTLIGDPMLAEIHVERGREWQRQFSWAKTAEKTLAVYEKVLGNL